MSAYKEWYDKNKEALREKRNRTYSENPDYREKVREVNRAFRRERRDERLRQQQTEVQTGIAPVKVWRTYDQKLEDGTIIQVYPTGVVCEMLSLAKVTLRSWEKKGDLPRPKYTGLRGEYLYTDADLVAIRKVMASHKKLHHKEPSIEYDIVLVYPDGRRETVHVFHIAGLAERTGRKAITLSKMERRGSIPITPLHDTNKRKLYTEAMATAIVEALEGILSVRTERDRAHVQSVLLPVWSRYTGAITEKEAPDASRAA